MKGHTKRGGFASHCLTAGVGERAETVHAQLEQNISSGQAGDGYGEHDDRVK